MNDSIVPNDTIKKIKWPKPDIFMANADTCFIFCDEQIDTLTIAKVSCQFIEKESLYKDSIIYVQDTIINSQNLVIKKHEEKDILQEKNKVEHGKKMKKKGFSFGAIVGTIGTILLMIGLNAIKK